MSTEKQPTSIRQEFADFAGDILRHDFTRIIGLLFVCGLLLKGCELTNEFDPFSDTVKVEGSVPDCETVKSSDVVIKDRFYKLTCQ